VSGRRGPAGSARARPWFPSLAVNALALVASLAELSFDAPAQAQAVVPTDVAPPAPVAPVAHMM